MEINTAKQLEVSIVERIRKENEQQDKKKLLIRKSIFKMYELVKGSKLSYEIRKQIEGIHELEILAALLSEIWNVKDIDQVETTINKYDWLMEMKRLDEE